VHHCHSSIHVTFASATGLTADTTSADEIGTSGVVAANFRGVTTHHHHVLGSTFTTSAPMAMATSAVCAALSPAVIWANAAVEAPPIKRASNCCDERLDAAERRALHHSSIEQSFSVGLHLVLELDLGRVEFFKPPAEPAC
jgi:hypothetical protein